MYLYNITIKISRENQAEWLLWMREEYIPFLLSPGLISKHLLLRLKDIDETDGPTYALQLFVETVAQYDEFITTHLNGIHQKQRARWGDNMLSFATLMEVVH